MSGPEYEQTDIIPALRADDDTAVDAFGPVAGPRHRRPSRSRALPAAGVTAILVASIAAMYATYTFGSPAPDGPAPAPPAVSEDPAAAEPPPPTSVSPVVRPSRTRADTRRPRPTRTTRKPTATPSRTTPAPAPTPPEPAPEPPRAHPTSPPPDSEQPDPPPTSGDPQPPTDTPEVNPS